MTLGMVAALVTCLTALALGLNFGRSYMQRRHTHAFWWSVAFLVTFIAALMQVAAFASATFTMDTYRLYIVCAAAVPALMGVGTMYLLLRRWALAYAVVILAFIALTILGTVSGTISATLLPHVMKASQEVTKVLPSALVTTGFAVLGSLGAAALVLGALWSYVRSRDPYNLGIALGGIIFSLADTLAAYGIVALFFAAQIVGIVVLYLAVRASAPRTWRRLFRFLAGWMAGACGFRLTSDLGHGEQRSWPSACVMPKGTGFPAQLCEGGPRWIGRNS